MTLPMTISLTYPQSSNPSFHFHLFIAAFLYLTWEAIKSSSPPGRPHAPITALHDAQTLARITNATTTIRDRPYKREETYPRPYAQKVSWTLCCFYDYTPHLAPTLLDNMDALQTRWTLGTRWTLSSSIIHKWRGKFSMGFKLQFPKFMKFSL